jgi:carboxymethylenebutenolidase
MTFFLAGWLSIGAFQGYAQTKSCCSKPTSNTETFAMLGEKPEFQSNHESPVPFTYETVNGKSITFKTDDGKTGAAFEIKAAKPTENYVFLIHEWWGLNDYIKQEAENLQKELGNVNVIALDLYDGKIATNPTDAGKFMGEVKQERAASIVKGAISYAGAKAKIYTIGWCFGGGWSLQASLLAGKQSAGCVIYYGQPEADVEKLKALNSDVLFIAATQDKWINPELVASFEKNMGTAGKKVTVKSFDADHAFANPSNPKHNKEFAAAAHSLVLTFLKERMKG